MLRKIENCPLIAVARNGNIILFNYDVIVKGVITLELTIESVAEISIELFKKGIDIYTVAIDESRMNYMGIEVL